ncbi:MAG: hypothetical protein JO036_01930 [Candidatus Eremiobacteraeota bacterium]|nr:hypothetical protein [Candidatus Eremiobacteraeota bacterium]
MSSPTTETTTTTTTTTTTVTTTAGAAGTTQKSWSSNGQAAYPITTDKSTHPFYAFVDLIGRDPAALKAFCDDPSGDPAAANLTPEQRAALLTGHWRNIEAQVAAENDQLKTVVYEYIGWNMKAVGPDILAALKAKAPA